MPNWLWSGNGPSSARPNWKFRSQLQYALRDMDTNLVVSETNFNRRLASQKVVEAEPRQL